MGGFMWLLRWVAAMSILGNCVMMTVEAALAEACFAQSESKPLLLNRAVR